MEKNKTNISYLVTVKDEFDEIKKLISFLLTAKDSEDEIIVLQDIENPNKENEIYKHLMEIYLSSKIFNRNDLKYYNYSLNNDFANFKNFGKLRCSKDYVFQCDADEIPSLYLIENLKSILKENEEIDLFWVPRINIVKGITEEWIKKWGWSMSYLSEFKEPINCFPDYQSRIFKNKPNINWEKAVHERIFGHETETNFPAQPEFCLFHEKSLEKQIRQNEYYSTIKQ